MILPPGPNQSPYAPENQLIVGKEMFQNLGENQDIELSARVGSLSRYVVGDETEVRVNRLVP